MEIEASDYWKTLHYFDTVTKDREAFHACILGVPLILIIAAAIIFFFPGAVAAIVGFLLGLTKPILWFVEARLSFFTDETLKRANAFFDGADANKDGVLTFEEIKTYAKANPWFSDAYKSLFGVSLEEALHALFIGADANQDGVLTREELHGYLVRQRNRIGLVKVLTVAAICSLPISFCVISLTRPPSPAPAFGKELPPSTVTTNGKDGDGVSRPP